MLDDKQHIEFLIKINDDKLEDYAKYANLDSRIDHERQLRETDFNYHEKALRLQASEYERRLEALNNEYGRARDTLNTYLPREKFDTFILNNDVWKGSIDRQNSEAKGASARNMTILTIGLSLFSVAVNIVLRMIFR